MVGDPVRLVPLLLRPLDLAAHPRAQCGGEQRAGAADRRSTLDVGVEERLGLVPGRQVLAADVPVHPEVAAHLEAALAGVAVAGLRKPAQRVESGLEVGLLLDPALDRRDLRISLDAVSDRPGDFRVALGMPCSDLVNLAGGGETLSGELADRLQHPQPSTGTVELDERLVHQRLELVEAARARVRADGFDVGERATAGEHRQPPEQALLLLVEQRVAPLDRRAQRLLPPRRVARARGEQVERMLEPLEQRLRSQEPEPRSGELERERQPVETPADLGDDRSFSAVSSSAGARATKSDTAEPSSSGARA